MREIQSFAPTNVREILAALNHNLFLPGWPGCNDTFRRPRELIRHIRGHDENDQLKPDSRPYAPPMPQSLGEVPETLPVHQMEPRYVSKAAMAEDRHVALGEWVSRGDQYSDRCLLKNYAEQVLRNIMGVGPKRTYTSTTHEYDFLTRVSHRSTKVLQLDDLGTVEISQLVHEGMILWGPNDTEEMKELDVPEQIVPKVQAIQEEEVQVDVVSEREEEEIARMFVEVETSL
jgi:hypothetical protein